MAIAIRPEQETPEAPLGSSSIEQRLEECWDLIRAAAWRWASPQRWDHEDLVQEAALAVWRVLTEKPDVPRSYIWQVALGAARDSLARGRSVDRPMRQTAEGKKVTNHCTVISMEALQQDQVNWRRFEARLVGVTSHCPGQLPSPTEELAVARVMCQEVQQGLTPRQRTVLELRLQGWTRPQLCERLKLGASRLNRIIKVIQAKTLTVWGEPENPTCQVCGAPFSRSPHPGRRRIYCSNACALRASRQRRKQPGSQIAANTTGLGSMPEALNPPIDTHDKYP